MEEPILRRMDGAVAVLTLNRPQVLNALNPDLLISLKVAVEDAGADPAVRALLITGTGRGFCAGADLAQKGVGGGTSDRTPGEVTADGMDALHNPLIRAIHHCPKPVVAAVNGVAAGGGVGLALACDIVLAAQSASFVNVFGPKLGISPDMGATWALAHNLSRARAIGLAFLGDKLPAEKAAQWGLIWDCVPDADLASTAMSIAQTLAAGPPLAWAPIRQALDRAALQDLDRQLDHERDAQRTLCGTEDFREGVSAFLHKRAPVFRGR